MRHVYLLILITAVSIMANAQSKMQLSAGNKTMTVTLADNEATRNLVSILGDGPITVEMEDYGGFEKVGALPWSLPASDTQITTEPGDIMLYLGRNIVIFYGSNKWSYTPIGKIDGATTANLREFLGSGNVKLTVSLAPTSAIEQISIGHTRIDKIYDLNGNIVNREPLLPGIYIINGKKTLIRSDKL